MGVTDVPETPLAREHATQQHSYSGIKNKRHGINNISSKVINNDVNDDTLQLDIHNAQDNLVVEAAVAIVINGIHYAVLMASPSQLEYLAIGFLFSEGLIQHSHELLDWEVTQLTDNANFYKFSDHSNDDINASKLVEQLQDYDIYVVELELNQRCHQRIQDQKRQLSGRTGCGMCGITGLTQALPDLSSYAKNKPQHNQQDNSQITTYMPTLDYLLNIRAKIDAAQYTHQLTGAVHAAATLHHEQLQLFEDVGRHNALDKLIGWKLRHKADIECVVMTSRLSIELVQKSIRIQIPWLVGMSAPTSTAVRVAQRYGLGLAGFLRDNRVTYYSGF
ncbi:formate dehydrogenase family accessory protein FdhD [Psychrobacter urativorans]|uniref:Sulfur carrier protein FdhD n=2 Tax=Psychrobacter urativorans TaxID=45610 RepID=A0A0M4TGQ9_9GAMM|nr:formate dehydrogenase family accessory protein FdhD [Psychrobacter urativorans]